MGTAACMVCGSMDMVMDGGLFVCQDCGCKYTVEQVRDIMAGQDGKPAESESSENDYADLAQKALDNNDMATAIEMFEKAVEANPNDYNSSWMAILAKAYAGSISIYSLPDSLGEPFSRLKEAVGGYGEMYFLSATILLSTLDEYANSYASEIDGELSMVEYEVAVSDTYGKINALEKKQRLIAKKMRMLETAMEMQLKAHDKALEGVVDPFCVTEQFMDRCRTMISMSRDMDHVRANKVMSNFYSIEVLRKRYPAGGNDYWENHAGERLEVFVRISELEAERKQLGKLLTEADEKAKKIKGAVAPEAPSQKEVDRLESELSELEEKRQLLGFFKRKEKEAIAIAIEDKKKEIESAKNVVRGEAQEIEKKHNEEIQKALGENEQAVADERSRLKQVKQEISDLSKKLSNSTL